MNYTEEFANAYEELQKAIRDRSHLVPKIITDKNGHQRRVMVRPDEQKNNKRVKHTENPKDKIINAAKDYWKTYSANITADAINKKLGTNYSEENIISVLKDAGYIKEDEIYGRKIYMPTQKAKDESRKTNESQKPQRNSPKKQLSEQEQHEREIEIEQAMDYEYQEYESNGGDLHFDEWQDKYNIHENNYDEWKNSSTISKKEKELSPELLAKDKQYKKDYLSNKKNSWTTDKTLKADYDKSGLKKVTDDAYKFYKDMITNIDDSKQKELQKRETKVFESDNWRAEVKFDGDSVRLDVYFMTKPDNAGPLYSYYQKINEKWNQDKGSYDWWASNQVHRENGLKYYNGFNKDADWLKPLNMVREHF